MRAARWLVLAYPPGPRREELLNTLADEADETGRRHPGVQQSVNLLICGLRARLGHPRSRGVVVLAVLTAVVAGMFGAAAIAPLGWQLARPLPQGAESDRLKAEVFPGHTVWGGGDAALWRPTGDGEGEQYGYANYWVRHTPETREVEAFTTQIRDRLAAQGWTIRSDIEFDRNETGELPPAWNSASFWATRDGLSLSFYDTRADKLHSWDDEGSAGFTLTRTAPPALWLLEAAAALTAALTAWLLTGWVARRVAGRPVLRPVTILVASGGLMILLPIAVFGTLWGTAGNEPEPTEQIWFVGQRLLLSAGWQPLLLYVTALLALATLPRSGESPRRTWAFAAAALSLGGAALADRIPAVVNDFQRPAAASSSVCVPEVPPTARGLTYRARVFIRPATTPDQRNLIEAAIWRTPGIWTSNFLYDPTSQEYREAYCGGSPLPPGAGETLPYFWELDLASPGVLPGLTDELGDMPGVVAVRGT